MARADWEAYESNVANALSQMDTPDVGISVDSKATQLADCIRSAALATVPLARERVAKTPWWSPNLQRLRTRSRRLRRAYQKTWVARSRDLVRENYQAARREYKDALQKAKGESWKAFVRRNLDLDPWGIPYKIVAGKLRPSTILAGLRTPDGFTEGWRDTSAHMLNTLLPDDDATPDTPLQKGIRDSFERYTPERGDIPPVTEGETEVAVCAGRPRKAPGPDGLPVEFLQKGNFAKHLTALFNQCIKESRYPLPWKKSQAVILLKEEGRDITLAKSYRPICLLDTAGKTFERVLNQRLLEVCQPEPEQYGFVRGRSTEGALVANTDCVTSAASKYQLALFVDISGAFDNLWWPSLFEELRRRGTPTYLYCLLRDYCRDREVTLTTLGGSVSKGITKGCPQG